MLYHLHLAHSLSDSWSEEHKHLLKCSSEQWDHLSARCQLLGEVRSTDLMESLVGESSQLKLVLRALSQEVKHGRVLSIVDYLSGCPTHLIVSDVA
jgi:hypothetical protein